MVRRQQLGNRGWHIVTASRQRYDRSKQARTQKFVAEVRVPDGTIIAITSIRRPSYNWKISQPFGASKTSTTFRRRQQTVEYMRSRSGWQQVTRKEASIYSDKNVRIEIQSPNTPPRLVMLQSQDGKKTTTFDFNPRFRNLDFGRVEQLAFTNSRRSPNQGRALLSSGLSARRAISSCDPNAWMESDSVLDRRSVLHRLHCSTARWPSDLRAPA